NHLTPDIVVFFHEFDLVNNLLFKEASITRVINFNLTHHLSNDDFEVLVIDLNTLQAVNVLNFIDDVFLNGCRTFDGQNVGRSSCTVRQWSTGAYVIVFLNKDLLGERYEILLNLTGLGSNNDFAVSSLNFTKGYLTVNFRNDCRIRRITSFK